MNSNLYEPLVSSSYWRCVRWSCPRNVTASSPLCAPSRWEFAVRAGVVPRTGSSFPGWRSGPVAAPMHSIFLAMLKWCRIDRMGGYGGDDLADTVPDSVWECEDTHPSASRKCSASELVFFFKQTQYDARCQQKNIIAKTGKNINK